MYETLPSTPEARLIARRSIRGALLLYAAFVVYGSLVPLVFQPRSLSEAWFHFQSIPMFSIGAAGRADWIANGVLYVPLALLLTLAMGAGKHRLASFFAALSAFACCAALAVAVEFAQMFFPPRTVSVNDLVAEWIGSIVGAGLAGGLARRMQDWLAELSVLVKGQRRRWLIAYALGYLAFSLFPYDFMVATSEFREKSMSPNWGLLLASASLVKGPFLAIVKCMLETLTAMPLGALWTQLARVGSARGVSTTFAAGLVLGLLMECGQFLLVSGVSQGASVATRAVGMTAGALFVYQGLSLLDVAQRSRRFLPQLALLYLLLLSVTNGWWSARWTSLEMATDRLESIHFLPFYYHYYTSEAIALVSLAATLLTYAPVAYFVWLKDGSAGSAALLAAIGAGVIEAAKLFMAGMHPDPSNVWIGAFAAWASMRLLARYSHSAATVVSPAKGGGGAPPPDVAAPSQSKRPDSTDPPLAQRHGTGDRQHDDRRRRRTRSPSANGRDISPRVRPLAMCVLLAALAAVAWCAADYPFHPSIVVAFLVTSGMVIWRWPFLIVAAIPAALPLLDFAPWSGRFYLDEFDLFVAVGLAVAYVRVPPARTPSGRDWLFKGIAFLVAVSYALSALRGLFPWQAWEDANAFTNYYSPYNALRLGKGVLWAFLCLGLLRRLAASGRDVVGLFAWGIVVGLSGTVAVILWERLTFPGLLNFSHDYRITGPFSQLHAGGADMEVFLTLATPFLVLVAARAQNWLVRVAATILFLTTTYAVMVTFSRAAYAALAIAVALSLLAAMRETIANGRLPRWRAVIVSSVLGAAGLAVAVPVVQGQFAQARLAQSESDLAVRKKHWLDALQMRDPDFATAVLGMGLGRYPETHFWRSSEQPRAATYRLQQEPGNQFLRLAAGNPIYVEQVVAVTPRNIYRLSVDLRAHQAGSSLSLAICEKWLFASLNCVAQTVKPELQNSTWSHHTVALTSDGVGTGRWYARRTTKLAVYSTGKTPVEIDNVRLETIEGQQLVSNGDFSHGMDRWFFTADDHMPWHIFSLPINVLFDQGWLGIIALGALFALAMGRTARAVWTSAPLTAGVLLASLLAWAILGLFNSVVDSPRILLLSLLLAWLATAKETADANRRLRH